MIKNVRLKKVLIRVVFPVFSFMNKVIKKRNSIYIYCANDVLNDNSKALFNYLIDNNYQEHYDIFVCAKKDNEFNLESEKIHFISKKNAIFRYLKSKYVFYSMGKIPIKPSKKQIVINMWHGTPFKTIGHLSKINNGNEFFFTFVCATSKNLVPIMAKAFGCPEKNVCICGEPKTDKLFLPIGNNNKKLIVWTPTFRQSEYLGYNDSSNSEVLPFFDTNYVELEDVLKKKNVKMIVKLHPLQDLKRYKMYSNENLEVLCGQDFDKKYGDIYELLSQSNALISDYSSVFLQYLLLNRPICFTVNDLNEYKNNRGFIFDNPLDFMPGKLAKSKEDIFDFITMVANNIDYYKNQRTNVLNYYHDYQNGNYCEMILKISGIEKV